MDGKRFAIRMRKELEAFIHDPPPGISCYPKETNPLTLEATILGAEGTPYQGGIFHLEVQLPDEYPFFPPQVRFLTPIFHPNIDEQGRICLDLLKTPPSGSWRCTNSISNVLLAIQCLLATPNPTDPLCPEIANIFFNNRGLFEKMAREKTLEHAQSEKPPEASEMLNPYNRELELYVPQQTQSVNQSQEDTAEDESKDFQNVP